MRAGRRVHAGQPSTGRAALLVNPRGELGARRQAAPLALAALVSLGLGACRCDDPVVETRVLKAFPERYAGVGLELGTRGAELQVVRTIAGAPAEASGLVAGDVVLFIDGRSTAGWSLADAVAALRGETGTEVGLTVLRKGGGRETFLLRRGAIARGADAGAPDGRSYRRSTP